MVRIFAWLYWMLVASSLCSLVLSMGGCASGVPTTKKSTQVMSLLGIPLMPPALAPETRELFERRLSSAQRRFEESPEDEIAIIWLGRRTAYLGRYHEAIEIYSRGLATHPESAWLLRHRGHRYLSIRRFDLAIDDLRRASDLTRGRPDIIEADGIPNSQNQPRSTLNGNILYHLGVAQYCDGDYKGAAETFTECLKFSTWNDDMLVATTAWLHRTLRRLGRDDDAKVLLMPIHAQMDIIENDAYLRTLLFAKGELPLEQALTDPGDGVTRATLAYGIATELRARGDERASNEILRRIINTEQWAAFGFIAAEADMARFGIEPAAEN